MNITHFAHTTVDASVPFIHRAPSLPTWDSLQLEGLGWDCHVWETRDHFGTLGLGVRVRTGNKVKV